MKRTEQAEERERRRDPEAGLAVFFENKSNIMLGKDNEIPLEIPLRLRLALLLVC